MAEVGFCFGALSYVRFLLSLVYCALATVSQYRRADGVALGQCFGSLTERGTLYVPRVPLVINHRSLGEFAHLSISWVLVPCVSDGA